MSARLLTRSFLAAALSVVGASAPVPAQPAQQNAQPGNICVQRIYPVADLVLPIAGSAHLNMGSDNLAKPTEFANKFNAQPTKDTSAETAKLAPAKTNENELIQLLMTTVEPANWAIRGGSSTVAYDSVCMSLVVNATSAHQEKIATVLAGLRRQQDAEVTLEVRIISVAEPFVERIGVDFNAPSAHGSPAPIAQPGSDLLRNAARGFPHVTYLNGIQVFQFLEAAQGDLRTNVIQAPKITVFNGQMTNFSSAEMQFYVTNVEVVKAGGSVVFVPHNEPFPVAGFYFSVQPAISADRKFVSLNFKANMTSLISGAVPLFPVVSQITPSASNSGEIRPVPFTQFLQQPCFNTMTMEQRLNLPDGGTALISGWRRVSEGRNEFGPPILSKIPYVNRLFKKAGAEPHTEHVMLMVTPRIIISADKETRAVLADQVTKARAASPDAEEQETPASLRVKYEQACTEGRLADAKLLAAKALALDPACFSKK